MSEDPKHDGPGPQNRKPDPIEDVRKGLGLLFRAAKSAFETLPTAKVEDVVLSGAREVGRALENVTKTIDRELFNRDRDKGDSQATSPEGRSEPAPDDKHVAPSDAADKPSPETPHDPAANAAPAQKSPGESGTKSSAPPDEPRGPRVG